MAQLTMFLVCTALLVTVNALPNIFDNPHWMDSSMEERDSNDDSSFMGDMDKAFTSGWMDMSMPTIPDIKMDSEKDIANKCKPGDGDCNVSFTSSKHVSRVVDGNVLENSDDYTHISNVNGTVTKHEKHSH